MHPGIDPAAIVVTDCPPTRQHEAAWPCPDCGSRAYFSWPKVPTERDVAALAVDARCWPCRQATDGHRREAPVQLSLMEV